VKPLYILFLLFLVFCFPAFAQEQETESEPDSEIDSESNEPAQTRIADYENEDSIFVINSFKYNVTGITLHFMLNTKTELKIGEEIKGIKNLEKFIQDKKQLLINERVLKDTVVIEYTIGEIDEDGKYPVDLQIYVEDTWNIIALPYPRYRSSYGFDIIIKARDYNFLGTMNPLRIDLGYRYDHLKNRSHFNMMIDSGFPFEAFGLKWSFDFDNYLDYRPYLESYPFFYKNRTGISVDIPVKRTTLTLWFSESFIVNEENSDSDKLIYGDVQEGLYMQSNPSISWRIPTSLEIGDFGELIYVPSFSANINHEFPDWPLSENRIGTSLNFSHYLTFGRIDWKNNLREGISFNASNSYSFNIHYLKKNDMVNYNPWGYSYSLRAIGHFIFIEDWLGLSTRLSLRHWIDSYNENAGDVIRGVYDYIYDPKGKNIAAELMFSVNLDLQFKAIRFMPSEWFPDSRFMRVFDFDMLINPIFDIAWYKPTSQKVLFNSDCFLAGAGIEFIIFPHRFRSLYFRISSAWDFSDMPRRPPEFIGDLELALEMGFHY